MAGTEVSKAVWPGVTLRTEDWLSLTFVEVVVMLRMENL